MREILFRGKSTHNGEWIEGYFGIKGESASREKTYCIMQSTLSNNCETTYFTDYEVSPETVGQYTGFTDKNGKKVFEGDILKNACGGIRVVVFMNSRFILKNINNNQCSSWAYMDKHEIVGNIHDNPELLKGE